MECNDCGNKMYKKCFYCSHGPIEEVWLQFVMDFKENMVKGRMPVQCRLIRLKVYPQYYYDRGLSVDENISQYWGLVYRFVMLYPYVPWANHYELKHFMYLCKGMRSSYFVENTDWIDVNYF